MVPEGEAKAETKPVASDEDLWHIRYEDGDEEDMNLSELAAVLVAHES